MFKIRINQKKIWQIWTMLLISLVISGVNAYATTYYVSTMGIDSNPGTQSLPFATIQKAASTAVAGDTIIIDDGTYYPEKSIRFSNSGTASAPIVVKAANKGKTFIIAPSDISETYPSASITHLQVFNVKSVEHIQFDGLDIEGGYYYAIQIELANNVLVKNCNLHHTGADVMKIENTSHDIVVENNEIHDSGMRSSNAEGIDITNSHDLTIRGNHIYNIRSYIMYTKKGSYNVVPNPDIKITDSAMYEI